MATPVHLRYEFGPYRVDGARRLLVREGASLALPPKTFDLLLMMVEGQGRVFTKKELMDALWPETFVEDGSLQFQIASLRRALGEEWIETLPRYGYRFKGEISEIRSDFHAEMKIVSEDEATRSRTPDVEVLHAAQLEAPGIHFPTWVSRQMFLYGLALLALLPIVYFVSTRGTQPNLLERVIRLNLLPPEGVTITDVNSISVSPDGEQLAFQGVEPDGKKQLWLRPLGSLVAERIQGTELLDGAFWSPNSRAAVCGRRWSW